MHVLGLWEEAAEPAGNPRRRRENMHAPHRKVLEGWESNLRHSSALAAAASVIVLYESKCPVASSSLVLTCCPKLVWTTEPVRRNPRNFLTVSLRVVPSHLRGSVLGGLTSAAQIHKQLPVPCGVQKSWCRSWCCFWLLPCADEVDDLLFF